MLKSIEEDGLYIFYLNICNFLWNILFFYIAYRLDNNICFRIIESMPKTENKEPVSLLSRFIIGDLTRI